MIQMSEKAVQEIVRLKATNPTYAADPNAALRVAVVGGGCSGMSYKLDFDSTGVSESDKLFEKQGVKLVIDAKSYLFLQGTELDFSDGLNGKGFVFNNPNAKRTCGCGSSFST